MKIFIPNAAAALLFSISMVSVTTPLSAQAETSAEALEIVNISARQRMLAQRIAGLSCLVHLDVEAQAHSTEALSAQDLFGESLGILRRANAASSASAENRAEIETGISLSQDQFHRIERLLTSLETAGAIGPNRLKDITSVSDDLFEVSENLTNQIQSSESQKLQSLPLMVLNLAGRQRMLSEKALKEFCLAQAGVDEEVYLANLADTISVFDSTMNALINGMPGLIMAPPTPHIQAKLEEVRDVWLPVKQVLESAVAGEDFDSRQIYTAAENLKTVRVLMNEAVALYVQFGVSSS